MHKLFTLLLCLCASASFSQSITLKGKIVDTEGLALESATVYLTKAKDTTVVDYTISDKNGNWELKIRKIDEPVFLRASFIGLGEFKQELPSVGEDKDFGTMKLLEQATELDAVVIKSEIPPIRLKSDTLEFNASSFKVRPDSNVETLLKQLPGVEIDSEGKITVNGKEVNQILVNGKPFFDKDGKIALQNLPADIINKVQVTDTKTKQEELSGQKAKGDNASINLTIDEDKNKGLFGKVMGGYGSDERYESSLLVNYFKGPRKISVLASSNNINATGFSMNEIFDSMGGGRNRSIYTSSDGSFGINGMQFGGGSGITRSDIIGANYADEWVKGFDGSGSYFYTAADSENINRSRETNFIPVDAETGVDNSYRAESSSRTDNDKYAHNFNTEFNINIDSTMTIFYGPRFVKGNSKSRTTSSSFSEGLATGRLLNDREAYNFNENDNMGISHNLVVNKAFGKKGRSMNFDANVENRKDDGTALNRSTINTYTYDADGNQNANAIIIDRVRYNKQATDEYDFGIEYLEPITDSLQLKIATRYTIDKEVENRDGFDFDPATGGYTSYNDELSNYLTSKTTSIRPLIGFSANTSKMWVNFEAGPRIANFNNRSFYMGENYNFRKDYVLPYVDASLSYRFRKSMSLWMGYSFDVYFPEALQVLPVTDISNPLSLVVGNPDLDPQKYHQFNLSFRDYDYATRSGYSLYAGGNYSTDGISSATQVDESAVSTTTYKNVSGNFYTWFGGNWSKSYKNEAHSFRYSIGMNGNYYGQKGFLNEELYDSKTFSIGPRASFTYEYGELLTINPSYNYSYNKTNYTNYSINSASNFVHTLNLQTTSYWPKHVVFGNDFGYTYNSQLSGGFRKDFYLWNTSIGYNFMKDKLLAKVKVYDVLNQNLGTSREIGATTILDQENLVLKRYVMFSLTLKLDKFGNKKEEKDNNYWFW